MKKHLTTLFLVGMIMLLPSCKAKCPPERISRVDSLSLFPEIDKTKNTKPTFIEIKGKQVRVDRMITGPVCNEAWSGVVYVTCDIQIPTAEVDRLFWRQCDFNVKEGSVVYVEAHKDKQYDRGCSCHE